MELETAHLLGTNRNPADGHTHTDIYLGRYAIEVKARKALPKLLHTAMQQAVEDLKGERDTPVVVLVESKVGYAPIRYALLRFDDFRKLTGDTNDEA